MDLIPVYLNRNGMRVMVRRIRREGSGTAFRGHSRYPWEDGNHWAWYPVALLKWRKTYAEAAADLAELAARKDWQPGWYEYAPWPIE